MYINKHKINPDITKLIYHYIKIYKIEHVLILAPSYKINNPGFLLAHELSHISHILPNQDAEEKINPLLLKNKLVFRTFASCKGLQSKCVIIIGLDENYFKYNDRKWSDIDSVPNVLSVATTRAIEKLVIIANEDKTLRTIDFKDLKSDVNILINSMHVKPPNKKQEIREDSEFKRNVIDFVKHKHPEIELEALSLLNIEYIETFKTNNTMADNVIRFLTRSHGEIYESVSHIYGRIIPKILRYIITKDNILYYTELIDYYFEKFDHYLILYNEYMDYLNTLNNNGDIIDYIKYIKHIFACEILLESSEIKSQYLMRQISNFYWININVIKNSINFLSNYLDMNDRTKIFNFEEKLDLKFNNYLINGRADLITNNIIYEFKYTESIVNEHLLQLGVYLSMNPKIKYGEIITYPGGLIAKVSIKSDNINKFIETLTMSMGEINNNLTMYQILNKYINKFNDTEELII